MQQTQLSPASTSSSLKSGLDGLWVVLVGAEGDCDVDHGVPVMAKAGDDQTFLLGFKNMHGARKFVQQSGVEHAEPRMVVKGNRGDLLRIAQENGVAGVLVDYDPDTQQYSTAETLY